MTKWWHPGTADHQWARWLRDGGGGGGLIDTTGENFIKLTTVLYPFAWQNNNAEERNVDFVLVWEDNPSDPQWSNHAWDRLTIKLFNYKHYLCRKKREIFINNLVQEGLLVEEGESTGESFSISLSKIHKSWYFQQSFPTVRKSRLV